MKSEVIRLVNEMNGELMEDLLFSIKVFMLQQEQVDINSEKIVSSLKRSLDELGQGNLLTNEEILNETKKLLSK